MYCPRFERREAIKNIEINSEQNIQKSRNFQI